MEQSFWDGVEGNNQKEGGGREGRKEIVIPMVIAKIYITQWVRWYSECFYILIHSILVTTSGDRYYYYFHFTDGEVIEAQRG